jgi:hypothetical protein
MEPWRLAAAADMDALQEAQDGRRGSVLIDGDMDFAEATDRLREHNELDARREGRPAKAG